MGTAALVATAPAAQAVDVTSPVVISEVYGGGGNTGATYQNDFIELYNNGEQAVDLSTWSVQYGSSGG
ncbi:MAG TPA: lamin tail domain-containing protein, partial [Lapillicoccus sp.]|nr:lamin tail domain-containing protein [Lapillicoccus sp.]